MIILINNVLLHLFYYKAIQFIFTPSRSSANNDIIQLNIVTNGEGSQQSNLPIPGYL